MLDRGLLRHRTVVYVGLICAILFGRFFTAFATGLGDAQLFDYFGQQMLSGAALYKDIWDIKPPGIFVVNAALNAISSDGFVVHALLEVMLCLVCAYGVYRVIIAMAGEESALLSAAAFALLTTLRRFNEGGNLTELYVVTFSVWAVFFLFIKGGFYGHFVAGILVGCALFFKLNGMTVLLTYLVYLLIMPGEGVGIRLTGKLLPLVLGVAFFWLLVFPFFYDDFQELIRVSFVHPFAYGKNSTGSAGDFLARLREKVDLFQCLSYFYLLGAFFAAIRFVSSWVNGAKAPLVFIVGLAFCDLFGALAGGRLYGHYFMLTFGSLAMLVGVIHHESSKFVGLKALNWAAMLVVGVLVAYEARVAVGETHFYLQAPENEIVRTIKATSSAEDLLYVFSYSPFYYSQTNLPSASRFVTTVNLVDSEQTKAAIAPQIMHDLSSKKPRFIVFDTRRDRYPQDFYQEFSLWLSERYTRITISDWAELYVLKTPD